MVDFNGSVQMERRMERHSFRVLHLYIKLMAFLEKVSDAVSILRIVQEHELYACRRRYVRTRTSNLTRRIEEMQENAPLEVT